MRYLERFAGCAVWIRVGYDLIDIFFSETAVK